MEEVLLCELPLPRSKRFRAIPRPMSVEEASPVTRSQTYHEHRTCSKDATGAPDLDSAPPGASVLVYAWGDNGYGQCLSGQPSSLASVVPDPSLVRLPPERQDFGQMCAGWEQSFLVSRRGTLFGGGSNRGGCLSEDAETEHVLGVQRVNLAEAEDFQVAALAAGRDHFVAVERERGILLTWGCSNEFGQTGQGPGRVGLASCGPRRLAVQQKVRVCAVACGQDHTLALTERGEVFAWGDGSMGQLGLLPAGPSPSAPHELTAETAPRRVEAGALHGLPVRQIAAGAQHSLATGISGQVAAWGCNRHGRLGLGPDSLSRTVVPLAELIPDLPAAARSVAAGGRHSAIILRKGRVFLAGDNHQGQLGQPISEMANSMGMFLELPSADYGLRVRAVALGDSHTLLLSVEGELFGMGANDREQLGEPLGGYTDTARPLALPDKDLIIWAIVSGPGHCLVLASHPPEEHARCPLTREMRSPTTPMRLPGRTESMPPTALKKSLDDEDPLPRTRAFRGSGASIAGKMDQAPPLVEEGGDFEEDETTLQRLRSRGCLSRMSTTGHLRVPLQLKSTSELKVPPDVVKHSRQVTRPGVAADIRFVCLAVEDLADLVQALPAADAEAETEAGRKALELLRMTIAAALRCPAVLSASFIFPGLFEARLDASGLCEQLLKARAKLSSNPEVAQSWAMASATMMRVLSPSGQVLKSLCTRDQIRALVVCLLVPDWASLLADFPAGGGAKSQQSYEAACELLRAVACLPAPGRKAFRDVIAEECGEVAVLRSVILPVARAFANAAVRCSQQRHHIQQQVWEAMLVLQLLWAAESRRLEIAKIAAEAARSSSSRRFAEVPRTFSIRRSLSVTAAAEMGVVHRAVTAAALALPLTSFQVDSLVHTDFPPELELQLFAQHARMQIIDAQELCSDPKWEVDGRGQLPKAFMSFMANSNLIPTTFKQRVLQAENTVRQSAVQQQVIMQQMQNLGPGGLIRIISPQVQDVFFVLEVHRDELLTGTAVALHGARPEDLRKPLKVKFAGEDGVDQGGVTKEYFRLLSLELFTPEFGMFMCDAESRYMWFDLGTINSPEDFWLAGVVVGLAVYNNLPGLDVNFPVALFKALKNQATTFEDFQQAFPSHAASLKAILEWEPPTGVVGAEATQLFEDTFCLDFSVTYDTRTGPKTVSLLPGADGTAAPVTLTRRDEFVEAFKDWYMSRGIAEQLKAFKDGFSRVCGSPVFNCLSVPELEAIVCGEKDLDFSNLRKGAQVVQGQVQFQDGYMELFWEILESFDAHHKRQFLKFVTGSDLAPVGGLERLALKIQRNGGEPTASLPTSHTCFNMLMLPEYSSREKLKQLIVTAIENAEGFGLE